MTYESDEPRGIPRSYVVAAVLLIILIAWVASGYVLRGEKAKTQDASAKPKESIVTVRARVLTAEQRRATLVIRGQTEALRKVEVRSETAGTVSGTPADKGQTVKTGDILCQLKLDAREAQLAQARAQKKQRELEYEGSKSLAEKGFRSDTAVAGDKAEFEGARAAVEQMEKEMENTRMRAPFDGIVDDRRVDVGDYMQPGAVCAVVIDQDPFLVVGQVSERDVAALKQGEPGSARLITGEQVTGTVRFVSRAADAQTRTFRVELEVPNPAGDLRDGVTAEIRIETQAVPAHRVSPAILGLDERGVVGLRTLDPDGTVRFVPVTIIGDDKDGIWVSGLPERATVITVGQEFVTPGQKVKAVMDDAAAPPAAAPAPAPATPAPQAAPAPAPATQDKAAPAPAPNAANKGV
ncbi:MAG TPA: efflux RND transporter periplasmic adaptor subunit [Alphaproteobacteria bacterium]|nr:efflux RND transporter periplasmic adaptor subunit [Alphaproteobacteria bacterium]HAJ47507.1 efflux RND transporter periplasmic adaptor subunit [Alphaproteobacteria bacterium]